MAKIRIIDRTHFSVEREADPEDQWDASDTRTSHDIQGIELITKEHEYYDLEIPFEPERDKTYYILHVLYSTGDTFHHDEGEICFVDLYQSRDAAQINADKIWTHYRTAVRKDGDFLNNDYWNISLQDAVGNEHKLHATWMGFFESLEDVEITEVRVR